MSTLCIAGRSAGAAIAAAFVLPLMAAPAALADASAVVFMYHRFGDPRYPSTNTTLEQFEAHAAELRQGGYVVRGLPEIVAAIRNGEALPPRTVALSIDDAFLTVYREAWPRFRREGLPFTLFIATDAIDAGRRDYMSWDQIRELANAGITIGSQTASHPHLPDVDAARLKLELEHSNKRFVEELGFRPRLFAYPFGEYGLREEKAVAAAGFAAAFGQHSGVVHGAENPYGLPRFAMNERYGSRERFRLAGNALPIPTRDVTPKDMALDADGNPPAFGFTVAPEAGPLDRLSCFASNQKGAATIEILGGRRIEVRLTTPFAPPRGRINCTMPAGAGRWRWFGRQFYIKPRAP